MNDRADVHGVTFGTGQSIFQSTILPAIEAAESEIIFVTCFWARSATRDALNESLLRLSSTALQKQKRITVRIGFSSASFLQKLFHPQTAAGRTYRPAEWTKQLGLVAQEDLGGLDLEVKSKFFLPFSVWHPKFVVIDRKRVFLPSCNVSWEDWFEGCVELSGAVVGRFITFWHTNWASDGEKTQQQVTASPSSLFDVSDAHGDSPLGPHMVRAHNTPCKFLPSPHNRNPRYRLPWQQYAPPPPSPLNTELLDVFTNAQKEIYIQTPNITSPPVLDAIQAALSRGVSVEILTSERLMILEQLVTSGTTTKRCVKRLIKFHKRLLQRRGDEEVGLVKPGRLQVSYYVPLSVSRSGLTGGAEPVQSHLKLTVVDNNTIVFGSGNMDRASWYTSQELGVAFFSEQLVAQTFRDLHFALARRKKLVYDSGG